MLEILLPLLGKIFDRVIPDPIAAANAKLEVMKLTQTGELAQLSADVQLATSQNEVNKVEAGSPNVFVSGWRPFIGWVCGAACAWNWIGISLLKTVFIVVGYKTIVELSPASITEMLPILMGMLGLGAYRSWEKIQGVASK